MKVYFKFSLLESPGGAAGQLWGQRGKRGPLHARAQGQLVPTWQLLIPIDKCFTGNSLVPLEQHCRGVRNVFPVLTAGGCFCDGFRNCHRSTVTA